jgi:hypothetical protein
MNNYNTIAYLIYLPCTVYITLYVGWACYKNGIHHLKSIFQKETALAELINKLLLIGYYLLNIGYATITLRFWNTINNVQELINILTQRIGLIVLFLGIMHYFNLWVTSTYGKKLINN